MEDQALGREAAGERQFQIGGGPAETMQLQHRMGVLGHRLRGDTADLVEGGAPDHRAGTAEEGRVPVIIPVLQQAVEHIAFGRYAAAGGEVPLERIGRVEVMRRLHHRHFLIPHQPAHGQLQESADRDVVAVENGDELAAGHRHRVVEVARFGVLVVGARDVADTGLRREATELLALAVVEDIDAKLVGRVIERAAGKNGRPHDRQRFVIGRNIDIDRWPVMRVGRQRHRFPVKRIDRLHIAEDEDHDRVKLGDHEQAAEQKLRKRLEGQGFGGAPIDIAGGHGERQDREKDRHAAVAEAIGDDKERRRGNADRDLLPDRQWHRRDGGQYAHPHDEADNPPDPAAEHLAHHSTANSIIDRYECTVILGDGWPSGPATSLGSRLAAPGPTAATILAAMAVMSCAALLAGA